MTDRLADEDRELLRDMASRASTLYWNSDRSVNSIADDLGLSKGRLYDLIEPLASGSECDNCGSELVFENRTAQQRDEPICPVCDGGGIDVDGIVAPASSFSRAAASTESSSLGERPGLAPLTPETKGLIAGLLVGTVAGVLLGRYIGH